MATLADVARAASVSKSAASSVLGAAPSTAKVSKGTRRRILAAARAIGYERNPIAVALATKRTHTIGYLVHNALEYLAHPEGGLTLAAIVQATAERGYRVATQQLEPQKCPDERLMDGCVILPHSDRIPYDMIEVLARRIPVLLFQGRSPSAISVRGSQILNPCIFGQKPVL